MSGIRIKIFAIILFAALSINSVIAQSNFRVMFYNVENLFDTINNPQKNDDDFLPDGNLRWNQYRYWKKLNAISQVIDSINSGYPPALIGLCEIENESILFDLTKRSKLRKHKYNYIITKSDDPRGINVALLYQRDDIKITEAHEYKPVFIGLPESPTRNILHVTGQIENGSILDIFVCHFKSRVGGIKKTNPYRLQTAQLLKQKADSIINIRKQSYIIIMGDFNDYPDNESMRKILDGHSKNSEIKDRLLYNMFLNETNNKEKGSYRYRQRWIFPDQFIVNGNFLKNKGVVKIKDNRANVYRANFLLEDDPKYGGKKPYRTYSGFKYKGGYSDHLPIYFDLEFK